MQPDEAAKGKITTECTGDLSSAGQEYLKQFKSETEELICLMTKAFSHWRDWYQRIGKDERKADVRCTAHALKSLLLGFCPWLEHRGQQQ